MRRSLIYFWRINLAVLLAAAVASAVLTGALLVGDSVRGSLRDLTLRRLGRIDHALVADRFFRQKLATELAIQTGIAKSFENPAPAILLAGTLQHSASKARAARINIHGIDQRFVQLFDHASGNATDDLSSLFTRQSGQFFPSIAINAALQKELHAEIGDQLLLSFERQSEIHRESLLGRRESSDLVQTLRLTLTAIIPDRGIGRFGLRPHQNLPLNAYIALPVLQKALGENERINVLLVAQRQDHEAPAILQNALREALNLDDRGLILRPSENYFIIESRGLILEPKAVEAVTELAHDLHAPIFPIFTYLANTLRANSRRVPYSTITALNTPVEAPFDRLRLTTGSPAPALGDDEILLNEWAAGELHAQVGDTIEVSYYVVGLREQLSTRNTKLCLKGILAMEGLAADRHLTPEFPGIHDADDMLEWDPPFPIDLTLIHPQDEAYWDEFRATPKAFVSEQTGQRLWRSRFGELTSIRIGAAPNAGLKETMEIFQKSLLKKITPEQAGFVFQPVKAQGLQAASGATDFSILFIGFSLFLIVSAVLLVGMLFRLGVEQRAREVGLLLSVGYPIRVVRRRLMIEGGILAGIGCLLGIGGAVLYASALMVGLRSWWVDAVGTSFLFLHVNSMSLALGYFSAIAVVLFSIWWALRQLRKVPAPALFAGVTAVDEISPTSASSAESSRFAQVVALVAAGLAAATMFTAFVSGATSSVALFFASGALWLIAGLAFLSHWLRQYHRQRRRKWGLARVARMAARNSARNRGRSMLSAALVGCACFVIVAVGANRREFGKESLVKESGTGGFTLVAESDIPLHHDLNSEEGRFELGFSASDSTMFNRARIIPFRLLPGEDASCLNLYQPQKPRILGVPNEQIERGGFQFRATISDAGENPWRLLERELAPGVIPAIGDYNSVRWILHLDLGQDLVIQNELGEELKLRLVGLLQSSIFQSELLISEANFLKHFPNQSGYSYFLTETPIESSEQLSQTLESTLSDYGFDATATNEKLANYQAVENTYLSVFQTLGGLGLLLGTLGLGIILTRNVIERRGELATLRAFGYRRSTLSAMLLTENSFLILCGILIGSVSALIAVAPHLIGGNPQVPWLSLALTLVLVFITGLMSSIVAVSITLRIPLLPALKAE
jgi:ABC-type antimicrobial peptide transport system permease subunit